MIGIPVRIDEDGSTRYLRDPLRLSVFFAAQNAEHVQNGDCTNQKR